MGRILTTNVVLTSPDSGDPVVLLADSVVPEWADGLIGDHAFQPVAQDESDAEGDKPAARSRGKAK